MKKQIFILLGVFVFLTIIFLFKNASYSLKQKKTYESVLSVVSSFDIKEAKRVLISFENSKPVEIEKEGDEWRVLSLWNARADLGKINKLLSEASNLRGELRASGEKFFSDFQINDEEGYRLTIENDKGAAIEDIVFGQKTIASNGYFVRQKNSEDVFFVRLEIADILGVSAGFPDGLPLDEEWANLEIVSFNPENVKQIYFYETSGEEEILRFSLEKDAAWKLVKNSTSTAIDDEKTLQYLATLLSVRANTVVNPKENHFEDNKTKRIKIVSSDGEASLCFSGLLEDGKFYYVKSKSSDTVFAVEEKYIDDVDVDESSFMNSKIVEANDEAIS